MIPLGHAVPILPAPDLPGLVAFYQRLGFSVGYYDPDPAQGYAIVSRGAARFHFFASPALDPYRNECGSYLPLADTDAFYRELAALGLPATGIPRLEAPRDTPWGMRELCLLDPAGNLLRAGHSLREARGLPCEAERVRLRRLSPRDLARFQGYRSDPEVGRYQGWQATSEKEAARFLAEMHEAALGAPGEWVQLGIADRESDQLVGDIGLKRSSSAPEAVELGFSLAREAQGKGLAAEALRLLFATVLPALEITRVIAIADTRNTASIRLLERLGMTRTATHEALFRGEPCQEAHFSLSLG